MELGQEGKGSLFLALGKDGLADYLGTRLCCRDCGSERTLTEGKVRSLQPRGVTAQSGVDSQDLENY